MKEHSETVSETTSETVSDNSRAVAEVDKTEGYFAQPHRDRRLRQP